MKQIPRTVIMHLELMPAWTVDDREVKEKLLHRLCWIVADVLGEEEEAVWDKAGTGHVCAQFVLRTGFLCTWRLGLYRQTGKCEDHF